MAVDSHLVAVAGLQTYSVVASCEVGQLQKRWTKGCAFLQCSLAAFRDPVLDRLAVLYSLRVPAQSGLTCFTQIKALSK
jgi:hypothetical protein